VRDEGAKGHLLALEEVGNSGRKEEHRFALEPAEFQKFVHPALPRVRDVFYDEKQDRAYILIDYVVGQSVEAVRRRLPEQRFPLPQVMTMMAPIAQAVIHLHSQHPPLIHGSIRPSNIIESTKASTVLVGFDFAKRYDVEKTMRIAPGARFGYAAPEQYLGEVGPHTDVYALGASLYTLLTGSVPAGALYRLRKLSQKQPDPLVPLNQLAPAVPEAVSQIIHRAMSISSADRFSTVEQFWEALQQASSTLPLKERVPESPVVAPVERNAESTANPAAQEAMELQDGGEEAPVPTNDATVQQSLETVAALPSSSYTPLTSSAIKSPATMSLQGPPKASRLKKHGMLILTLSAFLVTLLASSGVGASLWFYTAGQRSPAVAAPSSRSQVAQPSPQPTTRRQPTVTVNPQPTVAATTPVPPSSPVPELSKAYRGTLADIPRNVSTQVSLTSIRQQRGTLSGYFSMPQNNVFGAIPQSGPFQGTVTPAKEVQFTLMDGAGQATYAFSGSIAADNSIEGTYCSLLAATGKCGDYGLWSVAPAS
jgi:serine/threonine protein kinase